MYRKTQELDSPRPDVALNITREEDVDAQWDGDGPNPEDVGYVPFLFTVCAYRVVGGKLFKGFAYLGNSYHMPEDPIGDASGYLADMVREAVAEVDALVAKAGL